MGIWLQNVFAADAVTNNLMYRNTALLWNLLMKMYSYSTVALYANCKLCDVQSLKTMWISSPHKIFKNHVCVISMRKFVLSYATCSGTHSRIKCDPTATRIQ
jgi:hypothetical protein